MSASAPIRICDNGGWTDTWVARYGRVFNIGVRPTVDVRVEVFPRAARDARVAITLENYRTRYVPTLDATSWGPHPLIEAALRRIRPPDHADIEIWIGSRAPAGAATGTSAAAVVALLGALDRLAGGGQTPQQIAALAHAIETRDLGRECGVQDQLCSAFGGVNYIEIDDYPHAAVSNLDLPEDILSGLEARLAVIYLGRPHRSSAIHETVVRGLERHGPACEPLNALREAAERARDAAVAGDFAALGRAMQDNMQAQARLHPDLVHREAWRITEIAAAHSALGWKVNGAGGDGGSITVLCDERADRKTAMVDALARENPTWEPIPIAISRAGLVVSEAEE